MACAYKAAAAVLYRFTAAEFPNRCDRARRAALSRYFRRPTASLKAWVTALTHSPSACPVTKFGDGCFAMPALLASLPTEKRQSGSRRVMKPQLNRDMPPFPARQKLDRGFSQ